MRGDDKFGGGGAARVRGDCVGGASLSIEAVEREEADETEEANTGAFHAFSVFVA